MTLTIAMLRKFVKTRNKSGFSSNLQFQIDANACGFSVDELGPVQKFELPGPSWENGTFHGYQWKPLTTDGCARLIEFGRALYLADNDDPDTRSMLALMNNAVFIATEAA